MFMMNRDVIVRMLKYVKLMGHIYCFKTDSNWKQHNHLLPVLSTQGFNLLLFHCDHKRYDYNLSMINYRITEILLIYFLSFFGYNQFINHTM